MTVKECLICKKEFEARAKNVIYNKLEKAIIEYHLNNDIGIVVCEKCHDKLDPCFHKQKQCGEEQYENCKNC